MNLEFNLLLTNRSRVRGLWWGVATYVSGVLGLLLLHWRPSFWAVMALPVALQCLLLFWDKLFRHPGWVRLDAEGLAWANPAADPPERIRFAELSAYRFLPSRNGLVLRLCLHNGQLVRLDGSFTIEFAALWRAFDQAVGRYNQAHSDAPVVLEKSGLTRFFERRLATWVLWGLLALGAAWVLWASHRGAPPPAVYLPLGLLLPYLAVWANFYYQRT